MLSRKRLYSKPIMKRLISIPTVIFTFTLSLTTLCRAGILEEAANYNVAAFGTFTSEYADCQGRLYVAGNANVGGFTIGSRLYSSDGITDALVCGGTLNLVSSINQWGWTQISGGNAVYVDGINGERYSTLHGTTRQEAALSINDLGNVVSGGTTAADLLDKLRRNSAELSTMDNYGVSTLDIQSWNITLEGSDAQLNIFNVSAEDWSSKSTYQITAPENSTVIINIHGTGAVNTQNAGLNLSGVSAGNVLYNFVDSTFLSGSGFSYQGTVLAPYADAEFQNGNIEGQFIIGGDFENKGSFEFHNTTFDDSALEQSIPEPMATSFISFGGLGLLLAKRFFGKREKKLRKRKQTATYKAPSASKSPWHDRSDFVSLNRLAWDQFDLYKQRDEFSYVVTSSGCIAKTPKDGSPRI